MTLESFSNMLTPMELDICAFIFRKGRHGATWDEISRGTGIDPCSVSPRFKPLRRLGMIKASTNDIGETVKRKSPGKNRGQTVWIKS